MKNLLLLIVLFSFNLLNAQLNGTISGSSMACQGAAASITFTGSGGTEPYVFNYTISPQGLTQNITSSGPTATIDLSGFPPGNYVITLNTVTDAVLSTQTINTNWNFTVNPIPTPNAGSDQTVCEGSVLTIGGGGMQPGWTYTWTGPNGFVSTVVNPTLNPISMVMGGVYTETVVSQFGCMGQDNMVLSVIPLPTQPVTTIDSALCNNGSIVITEPSAYGPYTVLWNNGAVGLNNSGIPSGVYTYQLMNAYGCIYNGSSTVPQSALPADCATVSGTVKVDVNQDCILDANDVPVQYRMIRATPGNFMASTDANGNYTLYLEPGDYTIEELFTNGSTGNACSQSYPVSLPDISASATGINFLDTITSGVDLSIELLTNQIRPQQNSILSVFVIDQSGSGLTSGIDAWFTLPTGIDLMNFNTSYTQSNDTVYFQVISNQTAAYYQGVIFNSSLSVGSLATFNTGVEIIIGETVISNNSNIYQTIVVNSFDPNDKTTFVNGLQNDSSIYLSEQNLKYLIRFQNTGTAEAIDIHVMDTISDFLDLNTFEFLGSSHPCQIYFHGRSVKFDFPGIYLPDSTSNEPQSHGFILYQIRQAQSNVVGDVINNTAHIFFDFNEAVITNTTWDEIIEPSTQSITELKNLRIKIYPNPADDQLFVVSEGEPVRYSIFSSDGTLIEQSQTEQVSNIIDISKLSSGMYLLECVSNEYREVIRFVKQ